MKLSGYVRSLAARFLHRSETENDIDEELRSHIQHRTDDLERSGLSRAEAERRARIEFGGEVRFKEESREALGGNFIDTLIGDVRYSLRTLRKSRAFTVVAVVTLAMAIGANAVVFGVLNGFMLHPLNVPRTDNLYTLEHTRSENTSESYPNYVDLRDRNRSFDALAAWAFCLPGLGTGGDPTQVWGLQVSGNYFDVLRIQAYLGRFFRASEEHGTSAVPYVVLSYAYWHSHFRDDRSMVGRVVRLNKHPFTVIGVAPPGFVGTTVLFSPALFVPMVSLAQMDGQNLLNDRGNRWVDGVIGHLKPEVTPAQAAADLNSIGSGLEKSYPKQDGRMRFTLTRSDSLGTAFDAFVTGLMLLAGLILLAACANLGSLFAARAAGRSREVALRLALGAGRTRILRALFTEAILISLMGGAAGLWGSVILLSRLSVWQPFPEYPLNAPVSADANVYWAALLLSLASAVLFGAVPVRQVLRTSPYQIVKSGTRTTAGRRLTARDVLLAVQIAICALLVTSSIVAVRGLVHSLDNNFGFEPRDAMLAKTDLATAGYRGDRVPAVERRIIDAMAFIPGVTAVGMVGPYPPLHLGWATTDVFADSTDDLRPKNAAADAITYNISPEYFRAAGTTLLAGRNFTRYDDQNAPRVAVVNREFARKIFGSVTSAMNGYYKLPDGARIQVVGIVEDGKYTTNLAEDPQSAMFLPMLQSFDINLENGSSDDWLVVRSPRPPQQIAAAIRANLRELDPGLPSFIQTWNKEMDGALFAPRTAAVSLGVLGLMGAMLSIIGIFGMAAYSLGTRLKELGIRMALGAQRKEILRAALGRAFKLLAFGSAAGLVLGILASRLLAAIVYQATPRDPLVLAGVVAAMLFVGLVATWIPAHRALSLDPMSLLRED